MKKYMLAGMILWSFLSFMVAPANSTPDSPDIRGTITKIQRAEDKDESRILGTVLVEANEKDAKIDKANLIITDETRVRRKQGDKEVEATFEQLNVGDEIEARFVEGPTLMIYPLRAAASDILIVKSSDETEY
jgi:hypothetical protein